MTAQPLRTHERLWAGLPLLLVAVGSVYGNWKHALVCALGCMEGAVLVVVLICATVWLNVKLFHSVQSAFLKYCSGGLLSIAMTWGVFHYAVSNLRECKQEWAKLNTQALSWYLEGQYDKCTVAAVQALRVGGRAGIADEPYLCTTLNTLATAYKAQHEYAKAEPLFKRLLVIQEKNVGLKNHPKLAATLDNLVGIYLDQRRYEQAEPLCDRSLAIRSLALGEEHPDVAISLNNLAALRQGQGNYAEAESLFKQAVTISEKALGRKP